jgi:membrane fusion protein (multidrug efflux system)
MRNKINKSILSHSFLKAMTFFVLIAVMNACSPSPEKMELKMNRRIEKTKEKIFKLENKITGYEQKKLIAHEKAALEGEKSAGEKEGVKAARNTAITTILPEKKDFIKFLEVQGAVTSKENVIISANSGGVVMSILVTEGQSVGVGQAIARINSDALESAIEEVKNGLELAKTVYEKQNRLWNELKVGSEIQYLEAKNNKEALEKKLATLRVQLSDATVRSTMNGVVDEVFAKQGEMAGPGSPIARVVNLNKVQVEAEVPENYISKFKVGDKVQVYFQSLDVSRTASIRAVSQILNPGNRTFKVEVDLPNGDKILKPYLLATVKLKEYESKNQLIIPTKLIQEGNQGSYIFVIDKDNVVQRAWITIGQAYNGETEIISGLEGTENIVDLGFRNIHEGQEVKVENKK